jgi:hypothetical protein
MRPLFSSCLEFAVLLFGPCLSFGACYLVLTGTLVLGAYRDSGACGLEAAEITAGRL